MSNLGRYPRGTRIRTRVADCDTGPRGAKRIIPVGALGTVRGYVQGLYDIEWDNGGWTRWAKNELNRDATKEMKS